MRHYSLEATPADRLYTSRVTDRPPLSAAAAAWSGPITLIGDACHPVIPSFGQGANLALEDAADLAAALAPLSRANAAAARDGEGGAVVSLHGVLREWERARLERTTQAQIASFLMGSKSYGEAKFAEAMASSGISAADLENHSARFPDQNASQRFLCDWQPSVEGPLNTLAPEAQMLLARHAAAAAGEAADAKPRAAGEVAV